MLVDSKFESLPGFYYPKPQKYMINDHMGREIDISKAKVMLAEIPWVRLGVGFPNGLIKKHFTYSQAVQRIQSLLPPYKITFVSPVDDHKVRFGEETVQLSPQGYALLLSISLFHHFGRVYSYSSDENQDKELVSECYQQILELWDKKLIVLNLKT